MQLQLFLHDVVEGTDASSDDFRCEFGPDVRTIVDGRTKLEGQVQSHYSLL